MKRYSHQILKARTAKLQELGNGSLRALQLFVVLHLSWFHDVVVIDGSYFYAHLDNRWLAKQHNGGLVTKKDQTQLCKNKQRTKDKQKTKDKQGTKDEQGTEDKQRIEDKQRSETIGIDKANKSDEPSESNGSDCLFMLTIYTQYQRFYP